MEIPSPRLSFTSFKIGPSTLQGPHQVAKKIDQNWFLWFYNIIKTTIHFLFF
jgi:hypothetical protein